MAQATRGQILANQMSVFPVNVDQFSKYNVARVTAYFLCINVFIKGFCLLRFPLRKK